MDKNRELTIEFYDKRRQDIEDKSPNHAHSILAKLKQEFSDDIAIITQNVDNLFEKAGLESHEVIHLHGFLPEVRCMNIDCGNIYNIEYQNLYSLNDGLCKNCGDTLRPNIVFFGELAPMYELLNDELNDCQMLVVIGTSGHVIGVNSMANFIPYSILNNLETSSAIEDELFTKVIYDRASKAIDEIESDIREFLQTNI
jgi:NAD-dependent deacetylase